MNKMNYLTTRAEEIYNKYPYVVLDFETETDPSSKGSAINEQGDVVLSCWWVVTKDGIEKKHHFGGVLDQQSLVDDCKAAEFLVAHHAKFELQWLAECGLDIKKIRVWDTMSAEWVFRSNRNYSISLDNLSGRYGLGRKGDTVSKLIQAGMPVSEIPQHWLLDYCAWDVRLTHRLFLLQRARAARRKQLHLVHIRNMTCQVLADMETEGMCLDPDRVDEEYINVGSRMQELSTRLAVITGGINLGSSKQLGEFLFEGLGFLPPRDFRGKVILTPGGKVSTSVEAVSALIPRTKEQEEFLEMYKEYNKLSTLMTKNLEFFHKVCVERGCRFHAVLNQGITDTGRLSSSGRKILFSGATKAKSVQFQNIPRQYKSLFCSGRDDWVMCEADAPQLEFRVAADLGQDEIALQEVAEGVDVHSITADTMTKAGQPTARQEAKRLTFTPLYGGNGQTPAEKEYCNFFREKYQGIAEEQRRWELLAMERKSVRTKYGMVFYWPNARAQRDGTANCRREVYNYPVQGFATGEIIPIALILFWQLSNPATMRLVNTIHDSIVAIVKKGHEQEFTELAEFCFTRGVLAMLKAHYEQDFVVPLGVGVKTATHWGDSKEEHKYNFNPRSTN